MKDLFFDPKDAKKEENIVLLHILNELKTIKTGLSSGLTPDEGLETTVFKDSKDEKKEDSYYYAEETAVEEPLSLEEPDLEPEEETTGYIMIKEPNKPRTRHKYGTEALEQEAIATVTKNKKQIIKQKIVALASKNRITTKQIKEIIVDKHQYCSKATFYRYITELRSQRKLDIITINDREYICNVSLEANRKETYRP